LSHMGTFCPSTDAPIWEHFVFHRWSHVGTFCPSTDAPIWEHFVLPLLVPCGNSLAVRLWPSPSIAVAYRVCGPHCDVGRTASR
jgi:hypothetical protein